MIKAIRKIFELAYGDYLALEYLRYACRPTTNGAGAKTHDAGSAFAELWK